MNLYKTGLIRIGAYLVLGGLLTVPVSCERDKDSAAQPTSVSNRGAKTGDPGCNIYDNGSFLGTWTVTNSRLQAYINPGDDKQYVAQIIGNDEFLIRGRAFLQRTDIAGQPGNLNVGCFEGDAGDQQGFSVNNFQPASILESGNTPYSYRVKCSPRFNAASDGAIIPIGFWNQTNDRVDGRFFRGQWWVVQNVSRQFLRDAFIIRGRNMLVRSDVQITEDPWDRGRTRCFGGGDTGTGGLEPPSNAPQELVIEGYSKAFFPDGSPYFIKN